MDKYAIDYKKFNKPCFNDLLRLESKSRLKKYWNTYKLFIEGIFTPTTEIESTTLQMSRLLTN